MWRGEARRVDGLGRIIKEEEDNEEEEEEEEEIKDLKKAIKKRKKSLARQHCRRLFRSLLVVAPLT